MKPFTQEDIETIARCSNEGKTPEEAAKELGVSLSTLYRRAIAAGYQIRTRGVFQIRRIETETAEPQKGTEQGQSAPDPD